MNAAQLGLEPNTVLIESDWNLKTFILPRSCAAA